MRGATEELGITPKLASPTAAPRGRVLRVVERVEELRTEIEHAPIGVSKREQARDRDAGIVLRWSTSHTHGAVAVPCAISNLRQIGRAERVGVQIAVQARV